MMQYPALSPLQELSAYEALWDQPGASFRKLADQFRNDLHRYPSALIGQELIDAYKRQIFPVIKELPHFGVRIDGDGMYPERLRDAKNCPKILYYQGNWELAYLPSVAVVGTRHPSEDGLKRTRSLVEKLVQDQVVVVSGLAQGIDTAAHNAAIDCGGQTISVIGTPLNRFYPLENKALQTKIASEYLLISQVPFAKYAKQTYRENRFFFPERNATMSALTQATIIVEAGESSGTLIQARAALQQGRKLLILENNFLNPNLTWPATFEQKGAIRVKNYDEIRACITAPQTS